MGKTKIIIESSAGGLSSDSSGRKHSARSKSALVQSDYAGNENKAPPSSTKAAKMYSRAIMHTSCNVTETPSVMKSYVNPKSTSSVKFDDHQANKLSHTYVMGSATSAGD
ncbi:hypothetical protein AgCh_039447 [Apium graveolens]